MISKGHRFHGYGSLRYVYQNGKTIRGPLMALKFVTNEHRKTYRLAVVVSKKVNKSAVARNRIRRRLYEVLREYGDKLGNNDLVLTVYDSKIEELEIGQLKQQLADQLHQANIMAVKESP